MFGFVCMLVGLVVVAACAFEWGRAHMRNEIVARWRLATCKECGAYPLPTQIHRSGCKSGWPPDGTQVPLERLP